MSRVLDGIRVVDFGQYLAGPLAAMMLADQGADVIRVDPPGGPRWKHPSNAVLQRGKRSIVLDLKQADDLETARRLAGHADIVIENFRPGVMERLGLGAEALTAANSRLIYCSIPGFAAADPRSGLPGWEGIIEAATGVYTPRVPGGQETIFSAIPLASNFAAFVAANSIIAALIARERCGLGQRVEVPLYNAMFDAIGGQGQKPNPTSDASPALPLGGTQYQCADGRWIHLFPSVLAPRHFQWFSERFLPAEWAAEGLLDPVRLQVGTKLSAELRRRMTDVFKLRPAKEWEAEINAIGVPASVCQTTAEWLRDEHAIATKSVLPIDDIEFGATMQAGFPVTLSKTPADVTRSRHALDADRDSILAELDRLDTERSPLPAAPEPGLKSALQGHRIIDTTQILAGPTAAKVLAEFGAEVIKINNPKGGPIRGHLYVNSGKKSILLDIGSQRGQEVLWRLVEGSSAFLQNFRRGTAERMGLGETDVRAHQPDIVYSSVSAYGYDGPRGADRGWESLGQAPTGMQERYGGDGQPQGQRYQVCDYGTGMLSAFAILLGLLHRTRTGEGQHVQASLSQTGTYHQIPFMLDYEGRTWDEPRGREALGFAPFDRLYRATDRWLYLAAPHAADIPRLSAVKGLKPIDFSSAADAERALVERFSTATADEWVERLNAAGIAAHVVLHVEETMEDPAAKAAGLSVLRDHVGIGVVRSPGHAPNLSLTPAITTAPASLPGWDYREVLAAIGLADQAEELIANGTIAEALPGGAAAIV